MFAGLTPASTSGRTIQRQQPKRSAGRSAARAWSAPNFDLYLLEANYEDEEIQARIAEKKANGEFVYERRVLGTHLSKAKCDDFIYQNIGPTGEYVYLHGHVEEEKA